MTYGQFAQYIEMATAEFAAWITDHFKDEETRTTRGVAGFLAINTLLGAMGLKTREENLSQCLQRLRANPDVVVGAGAEPKAQFVHVAEMDLLNDVHRQLLANSLKQMFSPLGIYRIVVVGLSESEEGVIEKVFLAQINREDKPPLGDLKELFWHLATGIEGEDFIL